MTSQKFRQELKQEAERWQIEGLIDRHVYEMLAQRYQFSNLTTDSNNRFTAIIITFGCILLGLGVITFVAANWQMWSKPIKVTLLVSSFLLASIGGFYTRQKATTNWQSRLGQGLLLLSSLIFGANIGLMSQIFHQTGTIDKLYLVWGIGVFLMAYGLGLASLGIVAIILIGLSYFSSFSIFFGRNIDLIFQLMPIIASSLFIPLAYRCRSPWLFFLASCLTIVSFDLSCLYDINKTPIPLKGFLFAIAFILPLAFFWSYRDRPKLFNFSVPISFTSLSQKISILHLSFWLYFASFNWWWNLSSRRNATFINNWYYDPLFLIIAIFSLISLYWWWQLGKRQSNNTIWRLDIHSIYVAIVIIGGGILFGLYFNDFSEDIYYLDLLGIVVFNLMLLFLAFNLIRQALRSGKRLGYWSGISLLSLQILSRMLEYNTGLLFKALVLFTCGIAIIFAGIWFEKNFAGSKSIS